MKISRFFGITNREAMRQVRLALGPDALIVSNRRVNGGVEILATDPTSLSEAENAALSRPVHGAPPGYPQGQPQQPGHSAQPPYTVRPGQGTPVPPAPARPPVASPPPAAMTPPAAPSPMSPLGAYAAAFQAAYGPAAESAAQAPQPPVSAPAPQPGTASAPAAPARYASAPAPAAPQAPAASQAPNAAHVPAPAHAAAAAPAAASAPGAPAPMAPSNAYGQAAANAAADAGMPPGIMDAIGAMRGALETRIDELLWGNQLRRAPQAASLFQTLLGFGFSTALLRAMLKRLPDDLSQRAALQWVRQELVSHLPVPPDEEALWQPGLALALVGPTGVGKTTTIAKLAARCVRRFGPDKLVLITTDTYRIGAHEQLKIYGQMLRVPVHVVRNAQELRQIVADIRPDQSILIDNVGISQRDRYISEQAAMLAAAGRDITRLLVLNAASHGETLDEVARSYAADGGTPLRGCIITKVDEATRLGAALDTALRYRLPIHYVSTGQKVPEHLVFMSAAELVDQALTAQPAARTLYAPTEADLAALLSISRDTEAADAEAGAQKRSQQLQALPRLLSMAAGGAAHVTSGDLAEACEFIDELACSSEAYDLWRAHTATGGDRAPLESWVRHMLRIAQNEWAESGHKHVLAVHDQIALRAEGESPAQLRASLVLSEQGTPLSSPMQQLSMTAGWLSSCGASQPQVPTARATLTHQLDWLHHNAGELPLFHMFEGGNPALWRELASRDLQWMAQVPAITRVFMDDGPTTVQGLAKTLPHHPVADPDYLFALADVAGAAASDRALWLASAPVTIASRGHDPLPLHMVSVRLVDRASGRVVKRIIGLHPALDLAPEKLAAWLVVKAESREAMRHGAAAWALLSSHEGQAALQHKALVAAQIGMAAWQLHRSPLAQRGRDVAATILGKNALVPATAPAALLKLFTLKEMLSV